MLWMKGSSLASQRPLARPEKTANSVGLGIAEVTIASTKAIESTAPVFWSSVARAGRDAAPMRRNGAHHRGRVGADEHAGADADDRQRQSALCQ